ncbi:hypothetical protein KXD93_01205 [Mucilaginibacter sp. BJC16-A38]|uniref:hypothetical protein n=1 Tax=Mucilaginibacter phenanthrenivorans TaxID=1234842 RepID=UPI002157394B|nr:hypothetical protein [Mucilaginibacter phenanthrenivorans]MCR8556237.1 hypothetical protein [Mucilaginibacter phenanthrenivorans]
MRLETNMIRRTLVGLLFLAGATQVCNAQAPRAVAGPKGIWIICGNLLPRDFAYKILRKSDNGEWISVADIVMPTSKEDIQAALINTQRLAKMPFAPLSDTRLEALEKRVIPVVNKESPFEINEDFAMRAAIGTAWYDATADSAKQYEYKVEQIANKKVATEQVTNVVACPGKRFTVQMKPVLVNPSKSGLQVEYEVVDKGSMTHCRIYRSYYLRSGYEEINASPLFVTRGGKLFILFTDKTAVEKIPYSYVVMPVDAAGNTGDQSPEARAFDVPANSIIPSVNNFKTTSVEEKKAIKLSWHLGKTQRITSIDIYKSDKYDGVYNKIASVGTTDTAYFDLDVKPITTYYYTIKLNGIYQTSPFSPQVPGILRASYKNLYPPQNLQLKQNGQLVTLTFNKAENDTRAYYIYRATGRYGKLQQIGQPLITDRPRIAFTDSLPSVKRPTIYTYAVADENTSYAISPKTNPVYAYLSGTVAPPIPHDVFVRKTDANKLQVIWPDMRRESTSIQGYAVYRRYRAGYGKDSTLVQINKTLIPPSVNQFIDDMISEGVAYYSVRTVAEDGKTLSSPSLEAGFTVQQDVVANVSNIKAFPGEGAVELRWNNPVGQAIQLIKVYRAEEGKDPVEITTLTADKEAYTDKDVTHGGIYYYSFIVKSINGKTSGVTDPIGIHL